MCMCAGEGGSTNHEGAWLAQQGGAGLAAGHARLPHRLPARRVAGRCCAPHLPAVGTVGIGQGLGAVGTLQSRGGEAAFLVNLGSPG